MNISYKNIFNRILVILLCVSMMLTLTGCVIPISYETYNDISGVIAKEITEARINVEKLVNNGLLTLEIANSIKANLDNISNISNL
ncbi:MAG: hypothetical protein IJ593_10735, partial [Lachnospiraceae bacterium]|nr:hypothetical protein [Lachnospiraceae bacterium]